MIYTISLQEIIDGVLAVSSLRGDISGRGDMLADSDGYAIGVIAASLVPSALLEQDVVFHSTRAGWRVGPTHLHKAEVLQYLRNRMLAATGCCDDLRTERLRSAPGATLTVTPHDL